MEYNQSHRDAAYVIISIFQKETTLRSDSVMNMWISLLSGIPNSYAVQVSSGQRYLKYSRSNQGSDS